MRWILAAALIVSAATAQAQTPMTGTQGPLTATPPVAISNTPASAATPSAAATPAPARHGRTLQERFDEANTTHDGHLTREQARAKMPAVARDFDAIDTGHHGYVTVDEIKAHAAQRRAERRAAKQSAPKTEK